MRLKVLAKGWGEGDPVYSDLVTKHGLSQLKQHFDTEWWSFTKTIARLNIYMSIRSLIIFTTELMKTLFFFTILAFFIYDCDRFQCVTAIFRLVFTAIFRPVWSRNKLKSVRVKKKSAIKLKQRFIHHCHGIPPCKSPNGA